MDKNVKRAWPIAPYCNRLGAAEPHIRASVAYLSTINDSLNTACESNTACERKSA